MPEVLLDAAGRPRSPVTVPGYHAGRSPRNKGQRYPADPPTVAETVAAMRHAGSGAYRARLRALTSCCGAPGCESTKRSHSTESGVDARRGSVLVASRQGPPSS